MNDGFDSTIAALEPAGGTSSVPGGRHRLSRFTVRRRLLLLVTLLSLPLVGQTVVGLRNTEKVLFSQQSFRHSTPAALLLLNIDRDAYQAQLAAERPPPCPTARPATSSWPISPRTRARGPSGSPSSRSTSWGSRARSS